LDHESFDAEKFASPGAYWPIPRRDFRALKDKQSARISQAPREVGSFERIEDKFVVPAELKAELLTLIESKMTPSYPDKNTEYTLIESIYYDSPECQSFFDHFGSAPERHKLRTRRYGPNGKMNMDETHLELKSKTQSNVLNQPGISKKARFQIGKEELKLLQAFKPLHLSRSLAELNPGIELRTLVKRARNVSEIVSTLKLVPTCRVTYARKAYQAGDLRVTVDENITSELLRDVGAANLLDRDPTVKTRAADMCARFGNGDIAILEVKHNGTIPSWITDYLQSRGVGEASFSKYCFSMASFAGAKEAIVTQVGLAKAAPMSPTASPEYA
jgi:SPX domain protein involved in polyphosphate accumulation